MNKLAKDNSSNNRRRNSDYNRQSSSRRKSEGSSYRSVSSLSNPERKSNTHYYKSVSHDFKDLSADSHYIDEPIRRELRQRPNQKNTSNKLSNYFTSKKTTMIRRGAFDYQFLLTTIILVAFGIVMLYSSSSSKAFAATGDSLYYVKSQLGGFAAGIVAMIFCMMIDYHAIAKLSPIVYGVGVFLLILVLIPGVGTTSNGATRWVFGFQPSELVKFGMIITVAYYLDANQRYLHTFLKGFLPCLAILGVVALLLMLEPHFSATILITSTTFVMLFVAGSKIKHFVWIGIPAVGGVIALILAEPYRMQRLLSFGNPFADKQGAGYQIVQSLYAIGSGGFFGVGFGKSRQKYLSLPEPHNDFIFSVLAEELGWIGAIIVIVLFIYLIYRGIKIADKAPDKLGKYIVAGVVSLIGIQAFVNIAVVTASVPVTGMPLPFFSFGGTALTFTLAEIGLVLNVSRQERVL